MELEKPNVASNIMFFKKMLWITDYSTRMQRWLNGEDLPPIRIDAELHRQCNLNCQHCIRRTSKTDMSEDSKKIEVDDKRWFEIAREAGRMGVKAWNIAGIGEPMCKRETTMTLMKIIKKAKMFGELTTNGTLWREQDIKDAVKIGWDSINISIDAPEAETHDKIRRVKGTFAKATQTVKLFRKYRDHYNRDKPCLTINMVLNSLNYKKLPEMIQMTYDLGADAIFVEPMIVHSELGKKIKIKPKQMRELKKIIDKAQKLAYKLNILTHISCLVGDDEEKKFDKNMVEKTTEIKELIMENANNSNKEKLASENKKQNRKAKKKKFKITEDVEDILNIPCYYPWFYLIINADGSVVHCGEYTDLQENIKEKGLEEIWKGKHMEHIREQFLAKDLPEYCNKCRPNVIGDMRLVRKSIKEYTNVYHLQEKLVQLFHDNIELKEELYYKITGEKPPNKNKSSVLDRVKVFKF